MNDSPVAILDEGQSWELLGLAPLGRLAVSAAGEIDIFPINFVVDDRTVVFRTAPGTKLLELTVSGQVALEVDGYDDDEAWSVVLKGTAGRIEARSEIDAAERLPLTPWIPTLKYTFVRIRPTSISGRRFARGPEPDRSPF